MSEIKNPVPQEINDDELDMVAGGYTAKELTESRTLAKKSGTCPIEDLNKALYRG